MTLDYLVHLHSDSERFLAVLRDAEPTLRVPSCPEWDADDLLWHLAEVQWFWGTIVDQHLQDPDAAESQKPGRPDSHAGLVAFFEQSTGLLQSALTEADPAERVWMWAEDNTVGYIRRRQANEALIHRLDAELTAGRVTPLDAELASDGIHEALTVMFGGVPPWGEFTDSGRTIRVVASDTGLEVSLRIGRWKGTSPNTGNSYDEAICEPADFAGFVADSSVRGLASDLDAWLWGRGSTGKLTIEGDRSAFEALQEVVSQGIQ